MEVRTYFVRHRNALAARADFSPLYVDYYLHRSDLSLLPTDPTADTLFKDALAALTLHLAGRPHQETTAWTIHFEQPFLNLFVTGSNPNGAVVGSVRSEHIRPTGENLFFADTVNPRRGEPRHSALPFEGSCSFAAAEAYYRQSEQRPARYLRYAGDDLVMISAQPDCDIDWLENLDAESIRRLDSDEELSLLECRPCRWHCGCSERRLLALLKPGMDRNPENLFGGEDVLRADCPRCGRRYHVTRETLEAYANDCS